MIEEEEQFENQGEVNSESPSTETNVPEDIEYPIELDGGNLSPEEVEETPEETEEVKKDEKGPGNGGVFRANDG